MRVGRAVIPGLLIAASAFGQEPRSEVSVAFTDDLEVRYWVRDDRLPHFPDRPVFNYVEQVNRLTAHLTSGDWRAFAQVDQVGLFANRYVLDGELEIERRLVANGVPNPMPGDSYANLEKVFLTRDAGVAAVTLGDFYAAFGRGLALNVNRNVDIDVDTSIQGAKAVFRPGAWDVTLLAGQLNRQQVFQDNPNQGLRGDLRHTVAGASVVRYGLGPANVGLHGVFYDFVDDPGWGPGLAELGTAPDAVVGGGTVELMSLLGVDWFVEGDVFAHPTPVTFGGAAPRPGFAGYASATAYVGSTTWQLEGKRYADAERVNAVTSDELYEVAIGPTLEYERAITEDSSAAVNSNDLWGARLRTDWSAVPGEVVPYASFAVFRDLDLGGLHFNDTPETIVHPMVGAEVFLEDVTMIVNGGLRTDLRDAGDADADRVDADRQLHGDFEIKFPLFGDLEADITLAGEWFTWGVNALQQQDYLEMENAASLRYGQKLTFIGYVDYTTNPLVNSTGNLTERLYGAGEVQFKPTSGTTIKGFVGAYKAGIRCSGGQCRLLPGFEGARVSVVTAF